MTPRRLITECAFERFTAYAVTVLVGLMIGFGFMPALGAIIGGN